MCFVDLEKAYDRVPREKLWEVLREYGVRGSLLRHVQWGGDLGEDPGLGGEIISQHWPGNASGSPRQSWSIWPGKGKSGAPCLSCSPRDPTPDKRMTIR